MKLSDFLKQRTINHAQGKQFATNHEQEMERARHALFYKAAQQMGGLALQQSPLQSVTAAINTGTTSTTWSYGGSGGGGAVGVATGGYGNSIAGTTGHVLGQAVYHPPLPSPTGHTVQIAFMGADGYTHVLQVDSAYAGILNQISAIHSLRMQLGVQATKSIQAAIGDFSEEEMELAQGIIDDLGTKSREAAHAEA